MSGMDSPGRAPGTATAGISKEDRERDRFQEIAELARRGDARSGVQLTELLADPRWRVRRAAADALARCEPREPAVYAILNALRTGYRDLGLLNGALSVLNRTDLDVLPAVSEFLNDPNSDLRVYATQVLGERGDPGAVPMLLRTLEDTDINVRSHAVEALGKLRSATATDALIAIAEARDFATAWPALDALAAIGDARIGPRLFPLLHDELLAEAAVAALGELGDEEAVAPLVALLGAKQVSSGLVACALTDIYERYHQHYGKGPYIACLVRRLLEPNVLQEVLASIDKVQSNEVSHLAKMLGWLDGKDVMVALTAMLARPEARNEASEALVRKGAAASSIVTVLLRNRDPEMVRHAIELLGRIGDAGPVPSLIEFLEEDDESAVAAAGALTMIGDTRAYPALCALLGHPRTIVRQAAVAAVNSVAHPNRANDVRIWLEDSSPLMRESALRIACYLGYVENIELILACCDDESEQVRKAAVENIALLDDERIPVLLAAALRTGAPAVRAAAARALAIAHPEKSSRLLTEALADSDVWVRYFAAKSLELESALDEPATQALVRIASNDKAIQVRIVAVQALAHRGNAGLVPLFSSLAHSAETDLAKAALKGLGALHRGEALPILVAALERADVEERRTAIEALGESGLVLAVEPLTRAIHDEDREVAASALVALGHLDCAEAEAAIIEFMRWPQWRKTCISTLARNASERLPGLARGLAHPDSDVRRSIVEVLSRMRDRAAILTLQGALSDVEPAVRYAATAALAQASMAG